MTVPEVAEAAVLPVVDEIKGRVPEVYIVLQPDILPDQHQEILTRVNHVIETMIGKIARPRRILIVPDMPKTRSGKLMRRILAAISNNMNTGDVTTLANPDVVGIGPGHGPGQGCGCAGRCTGRPEIVWVSGLRLNRRDKPGGAAQSRAPFSGAESRREGPPVCSRCVTAKLYNVRDVLAQARSSVG